MFPATRHSLISVVRGADGPMRARAREALAGLYWRPVYKYLRVKWRISEEDAKDLTQSFFLPALDGDFLKRYDRSKAKFRTYLRMCLDSFVANKHRAASRLKRGGGSTLNPLDFEAAEDELRLREDETADPESYFRQEWVRSLFRCAIERFRAEAGATGKTVHFALFERYDLDGQDAPEPPSYAALAREFGLPVTQVTNYLAFARREFRRIALEQLAEVTADHAEFREEARDLFGVEVP